MVDAMTKSELIERLANKNARLTARDVDESVKAVLDAMTLAMATGSRIEIRGFGSFCLNYRPERLGRNPKSGAWWCRQNTCRTLKRAKRCVCEWTALCKKLKRFSTST